MSIKFNAIQRNNPLDKKKSGLYYAKMVSDGAVDFEELVEIVAQKTKLNEVDCIRALLNFEETILEKLSEGKIVRFHKLGNFQVSISSEGCDTERKVTSSKIGKEKVNFRAGKKLKTMLSELTYLKVKK